METVLLERLRKLSSKDKLDIVLALWEDIADEQVGGLVPEEHLRIVAERMAKVEAGNTDSRAWEEIRRKYFNDLQESAVKSSTEDSRSRILSYAGMLKDLSEDDFKAFKRDLREMRL